MKVGIAVVPDAETIKTIVGFQQQVASIYPLVPQLGTEVNLPHITLLQGRFKTHIIWDELILQLRDYCRKQKYLLEFNLAGIVYKPPGWYFLNLNSNPIFYEAHRFIFSLLGESMFLYSEDLQKDTSGYTTLERHNYLSYGYRYIGEAFQPHITLGKLTQIDSTLDEGNLLQLFKSFPTGNISRLQKITVYEMGDNGSHAVALYSVDF